MGRLRRPAIVLPGLVLAALVALSQPMPAMAQTEADESDWLAARADGSRRAFERYLQLHPLGQHATEAFIAIARMSVEPGWTPPTNAPMLPEPGQTAPAPNDVY